MGCEEGKKKVSWVNWDSICKPKNQGGLGVKTWSYSI